MVPYKFGMGPRWLNPGPAQGNYVAARAGIEPTTLRTKGVEATTMAYSIARWLSLRKRMESPCTTWDRPSSQDLGILESISDLGIFSGNLGFVHYNNVYRLVFSSFQNAASTVISNSIRKYSLSDCV